MGKPRKKMKLARATALSAAVAGILGASTIAMAADPASPAPADELGLCVAANSCKGKSVCATPDGSNSCKGLNSCKGKGVSKMSRGECTKLAKKSKNKKIVFEAGWTGM